MLEVVRVRCADPDPAGPGLKLERPGAAIDGRVALRHQPIHPGSCVLVEDRGVFAEVSSFSAGCFIFPTLLNGSEQTILSRWDGAAQSGWRLWLDGEGRLAMSVGISGECRTVRTSRPLLPREWAFVGASVDLAAGRIQVVQECLSLQGGRDRSAAAEGSGPGQACWTGSIPIVIAAHASGRPAPKAETAAHFNGKIDRPRLYAAPLPSAGLRALVEGVVVNAGDSRLLAAWDFSEATRTETVLDRSANQLHGTLRHLPIRAVTGANWDGRTHAWTEAPWQYGAIHFHADDVADAGWSPDLRLRVPEDWRPGFYALRLTARSPECRPVECYVPFFLRARHDRATARLVVVAPTATYLAYANSALRIDQVHVETQFESLIVLGNDDLYLSAHRELGMSTYDMHADGSGACYSSAARPLINMRPRGNTFNYVNDTHLLDWLEEKGIPYDLLTDEDLHREGKRALQRYAVAITMTHPEYVSREMIEALEAYQSGGGRHMYLGGNGFYWRIAFHPTRPSTIEVRRGVAGTRTWEGEAGENNLSFTGEPSGLWRNNGRPPQRLVGIGFDAQVFDQSWPYRRQPGAADPRVAFVFQGVGEDEAIGDFGLRLGGAAGLEVDRVDPTQGSPPDLITLATAECLSPGSLLTPEEIYITHRGLTGDQNRRVRADMVFFPTVRGGAVFATGSIAWCCSLSHNDYTNNVSRITENVLQRFLHPAPFDGFEP
jgi:N,N-dimethylformamidase